MSRPVPRADGAASIRLLAVSFGVTVVGTRLYLSLTGWPQIGGGEYHLAHALWGGLLLPLAAPIIYAFFLGVLGVAVLARHAPLQEPRSLAYTLVVRLKSVVAGPVSPDDRAEMLSEVARSRPPPPIPTSRS